MECNFCGKEIPPGKEKVFVDKKGKAQYFCSKKCEVNKLKLGRKPRKIKWTKDYREEKAIRTRSKKKTKKGKGEKAEKKGKREKTKKTKKTKKSKKSKKGKKSKGKSKKKKK